MAWGEWMVPAPGPEHDLTLERQKRAIEAYNEADAKAMLYRLCQLSMNHDLIIRAATRRIAELELEQILPKPKEPTVWDMVRRMLRISA
jgi:hypothetical protein